MLLLVHAGEEGNQAMELIQSITAAVEKFALYLALFRSPALNGDYIWSAPIQIESAKDSEVVSFDLRSPP